MPTGYRVEEYIIEIVDGTWRVPTECRSTVERQLCSAVVHVPKDCQNGVNGVASHTVSGIDRVPGMANAG